MPVKKPIDYFECRHGLGYSRLESRCREIASTLLAFVPLGFNCEVLQVSLENRSRIPRQLQLFSYVEFCLWNALDDMTNFQRNLSTGEVEVEGSTVFHVTEYRERRNHFAFFHVNHPISGFDTDRESFLGPYNGLHEPAVVVDGRPRNSIASGWAPIASQCLQIHAAAGRTQRDYISARLRRERGRPKVAIAGCHQQGTWPQRSLIRSEHKTR